MDHHLFHKLLNLRTLWADYSLEDHNSKKFLKIIKNFQEIFINSKDPLPLSEFGDTSRLTIEFAQKFKEIPSLGLKPILIFLSKFSKILSEETNIINDIMGNNEHLDLLQQLISPGEYGSKLLIKRDLFYKMIKLSKKNLQLYLILPLETSNKFNLLENLSNHNLIKKIIKWLDLNEKEEINFPEIFHILCKILKYSIDINHLITLKQFSKIGGYQKITTIVYKYLLNLGDTRILDDIVELVDSFNLDPFSLIQNVFLSLVDNPVSYDIIVRILKIMEVPKNIREVREVNTPIMLIGNLKVYQNNVKEVVMKIFEEVCFICFKDKEIPDKEFTELFLILIDTDNETKQIINNSLYRIIKSIPNDIQILWFKNFIKQLIFLKELYILSKLIPFIKLEEEELIQILIISWENYSKHSKALFIIKEIFKTIPHSLTFQSIIQELFHPNEFTFKLTSTFKNIIKTGHSNLIQILYNSQTLPGILERIIISKNMISIKNIFVATKYAIKRNPMFKSEVYPVIHEVLRISGILEEKNEILLIFLKALGTDEILGGEQYTISAELSLLTPNPIEILLYLEKVLIIEKVINIGFLEVIIPMILIEDLKEVAIRIIKSLKTMSAPALHQLINIHQEERESVDDILLTITQPLNGPRSYTSSPLFIQEVPLSSSYTFGIWIKPTECNLLSLGALSIEVRDWMIWIGINQFKQIHLRDEWVFITLVHSKHKFSADLAKLYIDGFERQSIKSPFPNVEYASATIGGSIGDSSNSPLISSCFLINEKLSLNQIQKIALKGINLTEPPIQGCFFFYYTGMNKGLKIPNLINSEGIPPAAIESIPVNMEGALDAIFCMGPSMLIDIIQTAKTKVDLQRGMLILLNVLSNKRHRKEFERVHGYDYLSHILSKKEMDFGIFDLIFLKSDVLGPGLIYVLLDIWNDSEYILERIREYINQDIEKFQEVRKLKFFQKIITLPLGEQRDIVIKLFIDNSIEKDELLELRDKAKPDLISHIEYVSFLEFNSSDIFDINWAMGFISHYPDSILNVLRIIINHKKKKHISPPIVELYTFLPRFPSFEVAKILLEEKELLIVAIACIRKLQSIELLEQLSKIIPFNKPEYCKELSLLFIEMKEEKPNVLINILSEFLINDISLFNYSLFSMDEIQLIIENALINIKFKPSIEFLDLLSSFHPQSPIKQLEWIWNLIIEKCKIKKYKFLIKPCYFTIYSILSREFDVEISSSLENFLKNKALNIFKLKYADDNFVLLTLHFAFIWTCSPNHKELGLLIWRKLIIDAPKKIKPHLSNLIEEHGFNGIVIGELESEQLIQKPIVKEVFERISNEWKRIKRPEKPIIKQSTLNKQDDKVDDMIRESYLRVNQLPELTPEQKGKIYEFDEYFRLRPSEGYLKRQTIVRTKFKNYIIENEKTTEEELLPIRHGISKNTSNCMWVNGINEVESVITYSKQLWIRPGFSVDPDGCLWQHYKKYPPLIIKYEEISSIHKKKIGLRDTGLEIYHRNGSILILLLESDDRNDHYSLITQKLPTTGIGRVIKRFQEINLKKAKKKWEKGELTNFDYLMYLNKFSGRSYNDLSKYPVFPWILKDYHSSELNLQDKNIYRDLSKPMGAIDEERREMFKERYEAWNEESIPKFHYGTHYSSSAITLHYLLRIEPFTEWSFDLQGGRFDVPDRLFHSIADAYESSSSISTSDVKELIPEFYFLPEFLININNHDFGIRSEDEIKLNNIILPPWSNNDPVEFIIQHRRALESPIISKNLHNWIDLIFGYKQRGEAAVEALNVFFYLTYDDVDLNNIPESERRVAIIQTLNFGVCPSQLFKKPHSPRILNPSSLTNNFIFYKPFNLYSKMLFPIFNIFIKEKSEVLCTKKNIYYVKNDVTVSWAHPDAALRITDRQNEKRFPNCHIGRISVVAVELPIYCTGGFDSVVNIWQNDDGELILLNRLYGHRHPITSIDIGSGIIVSGDLGGHIRIWCEEDLSFIRSMNFERKISSIKIHKYGEIVITEGFNLYLFTHNGTLISKGNLVPISGNKITSMDIIPREIWEDDFGIITGHNNGEVILWKYRIGEDSIRVKNKGMIPIEKEQVSEFKITSIKCSNDRIFIGDKSGQLFSNISRSKRVNIPTSHK